MDEPTFAEVQNDIKNIDAQIKGLEAEIGELRKGKEKLEKKLKMICPHEKRSEVWFAKVKYDYCWSCGRGEPSPAQDWSPPMKLKELN